MSNIESTIQQSNDEDNLMKMEITEGMFAGINYTIVIKEPEDADPKEAVDISYSIDNPEFFQERCLTVFRQVIETDFNERLCVGMETQKENEVLVEEVQELKEISDKQEEVIADLAKE